MVRIWRSYPAPASLAIEEEKTNGKYNIADVTEQLRRDFIDKCYICEIKPVTDPEVEHRLPHKNNSVPGRKFNWDNLYWSCRHCNLIKARPKYDSGILDCCKYDPEEHLMHQLQNSTVAVSAVDPFNREALLAAELIGESFNLKNSGIRIAACQARLNELQKEMGKLYTALGKYRDNPESKLCRKNVQVLLRKEGAFAAFKRFYVKSHLDEYPELADFLV